jgi:DNA-binding transcriptional LysR family regulator
MDIDQLIAFERIVREGSFSRAAWALNIAQPTISARIQALEQELGGPLFVRSNRRVTLTARGSSFLPHARRALMAILEGIDAAKLSQTGQRGRIAVGGLGSLAHGLFGPALARFYASHPHVECYLRSAEHAHMLEMLYDGVVSIALITWPCLEPPLLELTPLFFIHEPVVFVVPKQHPLAQQGRVTQAEIIAAADPFLRLRWWQATHSSVAQLAQRANLIADVSMEVARYLVNNGIGMGFFTRTLIADDLAKGSVVALEVCDLPPIFRDGALVRLARNGPPEPVENAFIECLREQAQQLGIYATAL